jgi:hypothetical protein
MHAQRTGSTRRVSSNSEQQTAPRSTTEPMKRRYEYFPKVASVFGAFQIELEADVVPLGIVS